MAMVKEIKTVRGSSGVRVLEMVKENGRLTIYAADDMDRQISFPAAVIRTLISVLQSLKSS